MQVIKYYKIITASVLVIMTITVIFALYSLKTILMPFIVAILLAYLFSPIIEKSAKHLKIPRTLSVLFLFIILFIVSILLGNLLFKNLNKFANNWPILQLKLEIKLDNFASLVNLNRQDVFNISKDFLQSISLTKIVSSSVSLLSNVLMTLLFMVCILFFVHTVPEKIDKAFDPKRAEKIKEIMKKINKQIQSYLLIKTIISALTGLSVYLILRIMNIEFAFLWGSIIFFLNYIPNIGPFLSAIPPILTTFLQYGSTKALIVFIIILLIQVFWGSIIETLAIGKSLNLSPLVVLIALVFWGWLWGIVGTIISIPLMSIIKITFSNIPELKPIAVLMSDK